MIRFLHVRKFRSEHILFSMVQCMYDWLTSHEMCLYLNQHQINILHICKTATTKPKSNCPISKCTDKYATACKTYCIAHLWMRVPPEVERKLKRTTGPLTHRERVRTHARSTHTYQNGFYKFPQHTHTHIRVDTKYCGICVCSICCGYIHTVYT